MLTYFAYVEATQVLLLNLSLLPGDLAPISDIIKEEKIVMSCLHIKHLRMIKNRHLIH